MKKEIISQPRDIPAVEIIASDDSLIRESDNIPRPLLVEIIREQVVRCKKELTKGETTYSKFIEGIISELRNIKRLKIGRVINGTGILVHTNLGRAPLSTELFDKIKGQITGYGNVEFETATGKRGKRGVLAEKYLALLAEAEAGTVLNNNAAALFIILNTFANRRKVVISRGELVQIGGGFRIPDIIRRSGAKLLEIGTTNITTLDDYRTAIEEEPAMILKVHQSNFSQSGFTDSVDIKALVELGKEHGIPVVNDLGSGVFVDTTEFIGVHEPTVQESVGQGAALTCFSGDKLLGGMQAGLIVGNAEMIGKIKKNPIFRALRVDKVVFSSLENLLGMYLDGTWKENIKLWQLASRKEADLYKWGHELLNKIGAGEKLTVQATRGRMGGGSLPEIPLPSIALVFHSGISPQKLSAEFRKYDPPIVGRIDEDSFMIDLKAIDREDGEILVNAVKDIIAKSK